MDLNYGLGNSNLALTMGAKGGIVLVEINSPLLKLLSHSDFEPTNAPTHGIATLFQQKVYEYNLFTLYRDHLIYKVYAPDKFTANFILTTHLSKSLGVEAIYQLNFKDFEDIEAIKERSKEALSSEIGKKLKDLNKITFKEDIVKTSYGTSILMRATI